MRRLTVMLKMGALLARRAQPALRAGLRWSVVFLVFLPSLTAATSTPHLGEQPDPPVAPPPASCPVEPAALLQDVDGPAGPAWPLQDGPCWGIRPGALFHGYKGTDCTANFVYVEASGIYIGTAAHCVNNLGDPVWFFYPNETMGVPSGYADMEARPPDATVAFIAEGWIYPGMGDFHRELDVALLRIEPASYANVTPQMCAWPGPTGVYERTGTYLEKVYFYGHGAGFHGRLEARTGVGPMWDGGPLFYASSALQTGDSGGPWIDQNGLAIGFESGAPPPEETYKGTEVGIHVSQVFRLASEQKGLNLSLVLMDEDPVERYRSLARNGTPSAAENATPPVQDPSPQAEPPSEPSESTTPATEIGMDETPKTVRPVDGPPAWLLIVGILLGVLLVSKRPRNGQRAPRV